MVIIWNDSAIEDLNSIHNYISQDSEYYATKLVDKIIKKVDQLENFSESGHIVRERNDKSIRELKEGSYRIIYQIFSDHIQILYIRHSARLFK